MQQRTLIGLIGGNIQKSLSPALQEDACAAAGLTGHYHLMDLDVLPGRSLQSLLDAARVAGFAGVNVTYPCKEGVLALLDEVSPEARQIGAVNTVTFARDGRTAGYNTDRVGFRRAFEDTFEHEAIAGKAALLVGCGGAGRAVAFALFDLGVGTLLLHDKDTGRAPRLAGALASQFGAGRTRAVTDVEGALSEAAGVVNATPVGMLGIPGIPLPLDVVASRHWVADVIYTPLETDLVKGARAKGCKVMGGAGMCVHQAAETFRLFTGRTANLERMRRIFAEAAAIRDRDLERTG
jgi:quinate/shikimate dehydrogenase (NAD+)